MPGTEDAGRLDGREGPIATSPASEADLREVRGAIALVASGVAVTVVLYGLQSPEAAAAEAEAEGNAAGVRLAIERRPTGYVDVVVGSREA